MNEAFEKILKKIEEKRNKYQRLADGSNFDGWNEEDIKYSAKAEMCEELKEIVHEVAEEYKDKPNIIDGLKIFLQEKFNYCAEQAEMNLESECNSEIASYFRDRKELYLDRANIYGEVMREIDRLAKSLSR